MALIKCPECGRENVSDTAKFCPQCGFNISNYYGKESIPMPESKPANVEFQKKKTNILRFLAIVFAVTAIISSSMWIKGHNKVKSINSQYNEDYKNYNMYKALVTSSSNNSLKYYDDYIDSAAELKSLSDKKSKQKKENIIYLICFIVSAILLAICFILL